MQHLLEDDSKKNLGDELLGMKADLLEVREFMQAQKEKSDPLFAVIDADSKTIKDLKEYESEVHLLIKELLKEFKNASSVDKVKILENIEGLMQSVDKYRTVKLPMDLINKIEYPVRSIR